MKRVRLISRFVCVIVLGVSALYAKRDPMVDATTSTTVITQEDIENLPVGRSLNQILQTVPGVTTYQDQVSINGVSPYGTSYFIDGMDVTNAMQPNQFMQLPLEAIEEIQILQGPAGAQYGTGTGGVINVITKSGGNEFHGSGFAYTSPDFLGGDLDNGFDTDPPHYQSTFDAGFNVGGPIIKDKLWFFGSFNHQTLRTQPKFEGDQSKDYQNYYPFLKFSYKHDENDRVDFWYNFNQSGYGQDGMDDYGNWSTKTRTPRHGFGVNWNHGFANGWDVNLGTSFAKSGYLYDYSSSYSSGTGSSMSMSSKKKSSSRFRTRADVSMPPFDCLCGEHDVEGGFEYGSECYTLDRNSQNGHMYTNPNPDYPYSDIWEFQEWEKEWARSNRFSFYLEDNVTVNDHFQVYIGTRYDFSSYYWPEREIDDKWSDKMTARSWHHISPRIGLTYDITGDGKNVARFSAARYLQDPQYNWYSFANPMGAWGRDFHGEMVPDLDPEWGEWSSDPADWLWWNLDELDPYAITTPNQFDPDFNSPILTEFTLAFEKALSEDVSVALRGFYKYESRLPAVADGSRLDMDKLLDDGELSWIDYDYVNVTNPVDGSQLTVYKDLDPGRESIYYIVNSPDAYRRYMALQLIFSKKLANGWMLDASFTYSDWKGHFEPWDYDQYNGHYPFFQDPNAQINNLGPLMYQSPWAVKITGLYQLPYGINATGFFQCYGGHAYTQQLSYNNPPLSDVFSGQMYGHDRYINAQQRGSERLPTFWMLNLGLEKTFKVTDTTTATLFVDAYNITNNQIELKVNPIVGSATQGEIERILNPGLFQFGVRVSF